MGWFSSSSYPDPRPDFDPKAEHEDVLSLFKDCFFLPMLADGKLDSEEFVPLEAAYFGLRIDREKGLEVVKGQLLADLEWRRHNPPPKQNADFCERLYRAWDRTIDNASGLPRITINQREELYKWVFRTLDCFDSVIATQVAQREEQKRGSDDAGDPRDTGRYAKSLRFYGVGSDRPAASEAVAVSRLFREVADRLKTISHELTQSKADSASTKPSPTASPSPLPTAPKTVPTSSREPLPARTGHAEAANPKPTPPAVETPETILFHENALPPSAQPPSAAIPTPQAEQLPAPPAVIDVNIADLMRDQPVLAGDLQALLRQQTRRLIDAILEHFGDFSSPQQSPLAFSQNRISAKGQVVVVPEAAATQASDVWFLGDIHGDILALDAAVRYIDSQSPRATLVFLGDLFDDHGFGYEVVLRVFDLITSRPGRVGYIAGNHDVALGMRSEPDRVFSSSVSPSDFADFLNDRRDDAEITEVGRLVVQFLQTAPRALFLPDGLIAAHAGVPLTMRWEHINTIADLERDDCLQDFTWTRAHERARKKIPNPTSKTSEFGFEDFSAFCEFVQSTLGIKAARIVRGHDHYETGYSIYPKWTRHQCITVNTMSRRLPRDPFGTFHRTPCVARWVPGKAPEVHRLHVPESLIDAYYKPKPVPDDASSESTAGSA